MTIRLAGAAIIIICSFLFAEGSVRSARRSAQSALAVSDDLRLLASLISFTRPNLHAAFSQLAENSRTGAFWASCADKLDLYGVRSALSHAVRTEADKLCFSSGVKEQLLLLSSRLGMSDAEDQQRLILQCRERIYSEYTRAAAELEKNAGLKKRIAVLTGALAAVILI